MISTIPVIVIDGPSGSGKGTLCRSMAKILKWNFLDSGLIYRILALLAIYHHVDLTSEEMLVTLAKNLTMYFNCKSNKSEFIFNKKNISNEIRTQKIDKAASKIAVFPNVRKILLQYQRSFRKYPGLIADGRDMGTIVFPDASVKIFLDASLAERTKRRLLQLQEKKYNNVNFKHLSYEIQKRDINDINRINSPLIPARDALVLDSTNLTIEQVVKKALQYTYHKLDFVSIDNFSNNFNLFKIEKFK